MQVQISIPPMNFLLACDKGQNLFCKGNDDATCKGQKTVCPLCRVVRLEQESNLHYTKAKKNHIESTY